MLYQKLRWTFIISLSILIMQSCTKEEEDVIELTESVQLDKFISDEEALRLELPQGGGGGNGDNTTSNRVVRE